MIPECERQLLKRLLERVVAPGGSLIVCSYGARYRPLARGQLADKLRSWGYEPQLEQWRAAPEGERTVLELAALRGPT